MELSEFWTLCSANGIVLDMEQLHNMERYQNEVLYWNSKVNLISRQDEAEIFGRHILHSLTILRYVDIKKKAKCLDVGTGGGFPGIPMKLARPDIDMTLLDSIAKKIKITEMFAQHTGLKKIKAVCSRAEEFSQLKENINAYDVVVTRAVARIEKVISWVLDSLKPDGKIVFLKGGDLDDEIEFAKSIYPEMKVELLDIKFHGADWFTKDEKKIVVCTNIKKLN
jgi:16S rRNA (guanine527-N7)-methyltransferase